MTCPGLLSPFLRVSGSQRRCTSVSLGGLLETRPWGLPTVLLLCRGPANSVSTSSLQMQIEPSMTATSPYLVTKLHGTRKAGQLRATQRYHRLASGHVWVLLPPPSDLKYQGEVLRRVFKMQGMAF